MLTKKMMTSKPNLYSEFENVGDVNSEEKGSGARYNKGKAPLNFIPFLPVPDCDDWVREAETTTRT